MKEIILSQGLTSMVDDIIWLRNILANLQILTLNNNIIMELYRKIYIKSEADLPKEEGWYFVHVIKTGIDIMEWDLSSSPDYVKLQNEDWINTFDWYLQPIEITDADIEAWTEEQDFGYGTNYFIMKDGARRGAKAVINGEIKHDK